MITIQKYGDHGVDIKLTAIGSTDSVFWSHRTNSYVVVENERGAFEIDGTKVSLVSINGFGEIRWTVERWMIDYALEYDAKGELTRGADDYEYLEAARHFGLVEKKG
jgi:hypothetical protein